MFKKGTFPYERLSQGIFHAISLASLATRGNKYSQKHGLSKNPIYRIWTRLRSRSMQNRMEVYSDWKDSPELFLKWAIEKGYVLGMSIVLKNSKADFVPENCLVKDRGARCTLRTV